MSHRTFSFFIASTPYHVIAKNSFTSHPKHTGLLKHLSLPLFTITWSPKTFFMPFFIKQPSFKDHLVAKTFLIAYFYEPKCHSLLSYMLLLWFVELWLHLRLIAYCKTYITASKIHQRH
jgi:hypothetical protein